MVELSIQLFGAFQVTLAGQPVRQFRANKTRALLAYLVTTGGTPVLRSQLATLLWDGYEEETALTSLRSALSNLRQLLAPLPLIEASRHTVCFHVHHPALQCDMVALQQWLAAEASELPSQLTAVPVVGGTFLQGLPAIDSAPFEAWRTAQQAWYQEQIAQQLRRLASVPPQAAPLARATPLSRHNLPAAVTSFIGRAQAQAELIGWLTGGELPDVQPKARLLTLIGTGGAGKTRLALQVAAAVLERFPDGVWLIELAALTDADLLVSTVATVLGVQPEATRPLLATLSDWLRLKQLLLVLDNCEHLLPACAALAEQVLRSGAGVSILATSREALGMNGERVYAVPSLTLPPLSPQPTATTLNHSEAVQLFVERATQVQAGFTITAANATAIDQICRQLDGIPLALELAAARVQVLPVEKIAERLSDRFRLLTQGNRTALPRHQTLRASIDWSYGLLTPAERTLLHRLTVFAGGWTLAAAEAICHDPESGEATDLLFTLTRLVEKSLVIFDASRDEPRYLILETIRQYGQEKVATAEALRLGRRHFDFFLAIAATTAPRFNRGQRTQCLRQLEADLDNLRAALAWACQHDPIAAYRLHGLLRWFWVSGNHQFEAQIWDQHLAALAVTTIPPDTQLALLLRRNFYVFIPTLAILEQWLADCRALCAATGDQEKLSEALIWYAANLVFLSEVERACRCFAEHEPLWQQWADPFMRAYALTKWGWSVSLSQRDFTRAQALHEAALTLGFQWQDPIILGTVYSDLSKWALLQHDYAVARGYYAQALTWHRQSGAQWFEGEALYNTADLLLLEGDVAQARALYEKALTMMRAVNRQVGVAYVLARLGHLTALEGDAARARRYLNESLAIYRTGGQRTGPLHCLICYADLYRQQGRLALAVQLLAAAEQGKSPYPYDRVLIEKIGAEIGAQLPTAAFIAAWAAGAGMDLATAVELALAPSKDPA